MLKSSVRSGIRLRGVRHNNLKNFDLDLPLNQLIVITGLSGSGKSSLAFDTLFAEVQRRYIETFSPYARQFLDRMDKPQVDSIEGIPPAIAVEQRNSVRTTRSTVGTMTEIADYMKMLWPHVAHLHCRNCGSLVRKNSPQMIWTETLDQRPDTDALITFNLPLSAKLSVADSLGLIGKQGYQRLLLHHQIIRIEDFPTNTKKQPDVLTVVQDRCSFAPANRPRFIEACEQAYHFGKGTLTVWACDSRGPINSPRIFSAGLHCPKCDLSYREPTAALFSFNHPVGACPKCRGFGRIISIDYNLVLPDRSKTLAEGVVKPWQSGQSAECQTDLLRACRKHGIPTDLPFDSLSKKFQSLVIEGDPDYGKDAQHEWPSAWYGVKGYFRWLESKAYKMHVRVLLSRYRAYTPCPDCHGKRFQSETLLYKAGTNGNLLTLADFYQLPIRDALPFLNQLRQNRKLESNDPLHVIFQEAGSRIEYLSQVGLGYLTLDRPTRSLSGGETERVNLTTCLGTRLVNTLFVLDEPSVGLHPRDTQRLVSILQRLRDTGNTVVVVEHEAAMMRAADQIIDLGPGHGATGGHVVFQGPYPALLKDSQSLTGQYLSGLRQIEPAPRRCSLPPGSGAGLRAASKRSRSSEALALHESPIPFTTKSAPAALSISGATRHNLKDVHAEFPLNRFVCVTGVSGSGKTTLVRDLLLPALAEKLKNQLPGIKASDRLPSDEDKDENESEAAAGPSAQISGWQSLDAVILVDQSILAKTPRSNPAVYSGAFDHIRTLFAESDLAKRRGLNASAFSFNSGQGQCERCRGAGFEKIEMQFLSDVFVRCPECNGRRYRSHILEIKLAPAGPEQGAALSYSIADVLDLTVEETIAFLARFPESKSALRGLQNLSWVQEVGLGYLKLGQPINTLSGGESQRLKLVRHLADLSSLRPPAPGTRSEDRPVKAGPHILFLFDEPTTGLHFEDVRILLKVFQRLVDSGHSVLVIEHNLDVIRSADWIVDLGPDAGDQGGQIVVTGTPEQVLNCSESHTGIALRQVMDQNTTPTHSS